MRHFRLSDRRVIGLVFLALGVMFLLETTDAFGMGIDIFSTYWPVLLIAWALYGFIAGGFALRLWVVIAGGIGVIFLLSNLNVWALDAAQLWPVALVAVGLSLLFGRRARRRGRRRGGRASRQTQQSADDSGTRESVDASNGFRASYIFGGGKERVTSKNFQGGQVSAIFGGMELDLRDAALDGEEAVIEATVVCGGIEVMVPRDWRVNIRTTTILGGTEINRSQPSAADAKGELTITGTVVCGGIEVKD